ncbi:MAG: hypothetical protein C4583_12915 [Anaerolineaceae bacterium]|nr:MAG: hypothetical protein C4583_12915 [Anaerolineaceae bacterium]
MKKSALILGVIAFVVALGGTIITPFCTPCLAIFVGAFAGYLAGVFDKPVEKSVAVKSGAFAGLLAGIGAVLGQIVGAVINGASVGPEGAMQIMRQLGLSGGAGDVSIVYWTSLVVSTACFAILNLGLMAGMGALGGLLWNQFNNKSVPPPVAPASPAQ